MATLLTVGNSEGERRCDAKCYDAEGGDCDCVCGGKNHGAGLQRALENTRELGERWLEQAAAHQGCTIAELRGQLFGKDIAARDLFAPYREGGR